jgi:hypothetical protein
MFSGVVVALYSQFKSLQKWKWKEAERKRWSKVRGLEAFRRNETTTTVTNSLDQKLFTTLITQGIIKRLNIFCRVTVKCIPASI